MPQAHLPHQLILGWLPLNNPWEHVHVDHAQWNKQLLLVAIDAFSKWPEVFLVSSTYHGFTNNGQTTNHFVTQWLPITLLSDNGPPFSSIEFKKFMKGNGITYCRVPPYHPSSNGLAENMVKSLNKHCIKQTRVIHLKQIAKFLASYRNTPHSVTGRILAEILLGWSPRTRLSLVHLCISQRMSVVLEEWVGGKSPQNFEIGQAVFLEDLCPIASSKWRPATISCKFGPLTYVTRFAKTGLVRTK